MHLHLSTLYSVINIMNCVYLSCSLSCHLQRDATRGVVYAGQLNVIAEVQEEQKFLQQRVETLQKELEMYAERSRHEVEQLKSELNSTQEVCPSYQISKCMLASPCHLLTTTACKQYVSACKLLSCNCRTHV